jgi:two-component system, cell cycle sensor histidine kinase and response regulator CckA
MSTDDSERANRCLSALVETMRTTVASTSEAPCLPDALAGRIAEALADGPEDESFASNLANLGALVLSNARQGDAARRELAQLKRAGEEAKRFIALIQHSRDFIGLASLDERVVFVNDAGRDLVGLERDQDLGEIPLRAFHTEDGMKRADILREVGHWEGEGQLHHFKTGELIDVQISSFLVRDEKGNPFGYATVQRDIRERKRLEDQLRQLQKMEAIGRLAGGIAHDFNNLLTVILSYSLTLGRDLSLDSAARADVQEIHTAGERAAALTRQLLAFSRQQVLEPRVIDLNTTLAGMAAMMRRLLGEDVELRIVAGPGSQWVTADVVQMEQVILNLALNARDAMPDGGTLTFATTRVDLDEGGAAEVGVRAGPHVMLTVSDTGVGMDTATLGRAFEPFFTTKDKTKGTGLGLATVFGIVEQSGGSIRASSEPGKGSTFKVVLPRSDGASVNAPARNIAPPSTVGGTETILLVEDETQLRTLLTRVLRRAGYHVLDAPGPEDALSQSASFGGEIHLLVTDVVMPQMNGRQLAERLTCVRRATKVLYLSGYSADIVAHHGVLDPGIMLLQKPFTPESLLRGVREALDREGQFDCQSAHTLADQPFAL